jgi:chromosomal replication initiation ATPase DnaA
VIDWIRRQNALMKELYDAIGAGFTPAGFTVAQDKEYRNFKLRQFIQRALECENLSPNEFFGQSRTKPLGRMRIIICYEARLAGYSLKEIGNAICRDHSTVLYAAGRYEAHMNYQDFEQVAKRIRELHTALRNQ